jgi:Tol biopolymer transport system component
VSVAVHSDIWVYDRSRDALSRLTSKRNNELRPVWTPDGKRIVYRSFTSSSAASDNALSWRLADGGGQEQVLIRSAGALVPGSWHPTKNVLAYVATMPTTRQDVMLLPIEGDDVHGWKAAQPIAFANSTANERGPAFSPDGKWLAYYSSSNESGRDDVYVQPFPGPGARVIVSSDQSSERPSWSRTRRELVFTTAGADYARLLMVAPYVVEAGAFRAGKPHPWTPRGSLRNLLDERIYALHPDGIRVAIAPPGEDDDVAQNHVTFVLNFFDELRRIAPRPSH